MNPIRQNYAHVKSIESFLCKYGYDNIPVYSIIAFPGGATLKLKIKDENVVKKNILQKMKLGTYLNY